MQMAILILNRNKVKNFVMTCSKQSVEFLLSLAVDYSGFNLLCRSVNFVNIY